MSVHIRIRGLGYTGLGHGLGLYLAHCTGLGLYLAYCTGYLATFTHCTGYLATFTHCTGTGTVLTLLYRYWDCPNPTVPGIGLLVPLYRVLGYWSHCTGYLAILTHCTGYLAILTHCTGFCTPHCTGFCTPHCTGFCTPHCTGFWTFPRSPTGVSLPRSRPWCPMGGVPGSVLERFPGPVPAVFKRLRACKRSRTKPSVNLW